MNKKVEETANDPHIQYIEKEWAKEKV